MHQKALKTHIPSSAVEFRNFAVENCAKELRMIIDTLIFTSSGGDNLRVGDGNGQRGFP